MGVAKVVNNWNDLVKGSSTRQKLQNSKGYTESPAFSPALELIIWKKSFTTNLRKIRSLVCSITNFFCAHIYTRTDPITLPCSLCARGLLNNF